VIEAGFEARLDDLEVGERSKSRREQAVVSDMEDFLARLLAQVAPSWAGSGSGSTGMPAQ
jgi:hypothetical protein